jgi:hypothetical protein
LGPKIVHVIEDTWLGDNEHGHLLRKILGEIRENIWEGPSSNSLAFSESERNELFSILATDCALEDPIEAANTCIRSLCSIFARDSLAKVNQKAAQQRKFTGDKKLLDDVHFFESLQEEKLRLRQLLASCPRLELKYESSEYGK